MTETLEELAEAEFIARERLRAMAQSNIPFDYEERKKSAIEYAKAQAAAVAARAALDAAIHKAK